MSLLSLAILRVLLMNCSLIKAAPASAVTMWTYERVLSLLMELEAAKKKRLDD